MQIQADRPTTATGESYHLLLKDGDIAPLCILAGASGRVKFIGERYLTDTRSIINKDRGDMVSCTGFYQGHRISAVGTGMGGSSTGISIEEVIKHGGRVIVRSGSSSSLRKKSVPGDVVIVTAAIRKDGASSHWAPMEFPAAADYRIVSALVAAANQLGPGHFEVGYECTTADFNTGQGRPDLFGYLPPVSQAEHEWNLRHGVACYSMEAASIFTYCSAEARGYAIAGAINAVYGNRVTNAWDPHKGQELACEIALEALVSLAKDEGVQAIMNRPFSEFVDRPVWEG